MGFSGFGKVNIQRGSTPLPRAKNNCDIMQNLQPNTTLQGGKYRIERVLGQGGFGNTYVGYNTEFEETVAIKEFFMKGVTERNETTCVVSVSNADNVQQFEEQREKFKKEARRLRKLKNEHIVKVHDLFEENGTAYYVMDYIEGENLSERLKRTVMPLSEAEVRDILIQVLDALKEVHQNEIWHLDLKPGNIMLDKSGKVYLIDFGASKQIRANGGLTTSTALCYTPGYAPNEQIGQMYDRFGPWTDIYALGATIYNLLTNKKPPMAIDIEEDGEEAFAFPRGISEEMQKLVIWLMQPKRKTRPQNMEEIISALRASKKEENILSREKPENEETIIANLPLSSPAPTVMKEEKIKKEIVTDSDSETTILQVAKNGKEINKSLDSEREIVDRAICIGDFIFEDGSYSDELGDRGNKLIGVLFSYQGGTHGRILSSKVSEDKLSINGKELEWHAASVSEWVDIIQNLCHCKVSYESWEYKFFPKFNYDLYPKIFPQLSYKTTESVNGYSYIVDLLDKKLRINDYNDNVLPFIYVADF